jgi:hypothetical protein
MEVASRLVAERGCFDARVAAQLSQVSLAETRRTLDAMRRAGDLARAGRLPQGQRRPGRPPTLYTFPRPGPADDPLVQLGLCARSWAQFQ